ncbi:DUF4272 domain-containing protein [Massilia sp. erpn]|uniref:DUF4272 domain-containing protein n=1 Tax=Massilia sp. erpn TaxID=2738142 RepID=UPI0021084D5E|nr:DUF4272 domain-containing protein [Massilia sp. erpn]UTY58316.1 DUF4272 domain-containing protein [Massilia sp. erpn]
MEYLKSQNEEQLRTLGVGVNPHLPCIESLEEVEPRSASDVAKQLVALSYMIRIGYDYPIAEAREGLAQLGLLDILGSTAKKILASGELTEQQKIDLTWQAEAAQSLAWALGMTELDHTRPCDEDLADRTPFGEGEREFIQAAQLRPMSEIQQQADLIYRMHWYAVNCRLVGEACVLNESIIRERRRALDWMYGVAEDWDQVPMDT